jgi:osmotically-inducible protein OsmY
MVKCMNATTNSTQPLEIAAQHMAVAVNIRSEDDEIAQNALRELRARGYEGLLSITCEHHEGMLVLRGCVPSYHLKQLAQVAVSKVPGVKLVVNSVTVEATKRPEPISITPE